MSGRRFTTASVLPIQPKRSRTRTAIERDGGLLATALPAEKPRRVAKEKHPDQDRANLVGDTAVRAAALFARAWPELTYPIVRSVTIHAIYLAFAASLGMRVPTLENVLAPYAGPGLDAFLTEVRALPFADLTPEHFGAAHEVLTDYHLIESRLEKSGGRRAGGVHFTPRSLTEPIVSKTLEPLLKLVPPERTLELRVCDPSVGGGAFLLELVRQLGARVHDAGLARSLEEAKRLVAIHCAYGVDICRYAVATTKLALTLECRADRMPADWLNDNVKHGDGLVGLQNDQLARFHWSPDGKDKKGKALPAHLEIQRVLDDAMAAGVARRKSRLETLSSLAQGAT
jgi:hypothetical protein